MFCKLTQNHTPESDGGNQIATLLAVLRTFSKLELVFKAITMIRHFITGSDYANSLFRFSPELA